jgi:hypothetical protein
MKCHRIKASIVDPFDIVDQPSLPSEVSFLAGRMIVAPLPTPMVFTINHPPGRRPGHWLGNITPVVSVEMVEALKASGVDNFQTFPAVLHRLSDGAMLHDHVAFNSVGLVQGACMDKSTWDVIMPGGHGQMPDLVDFSHLVLAEARVRGLGLFRLVENPLDVFVSDEVLAVLAARRPEGGWGITVYEVAVA